MPMLMKGNVWKERRNAVDRKGNPIVTYPVIAEDKHDEIRVHVKVDYPNQQVQFLSYSGKPLANMGKFAQSFLTLTRGLGYEEFDMGFECNGNFNDSYRWVRSTKGVPDDLTNAAHKFYIFGVPIDCTLEQQAIVRSIIAEYARDWVSFPMVLPRASMCYDESRVYSAFESARARGLEGLMIKQPQHMYQRKRTDGWLKMKPEDDADGVITGLEEAVCGTDQPELGLMVGDRLGRIGSVHVRMEDGSTASPHGIPFDLGKEMFEHPERFIGQWCEFKYMERDRKGGYRHPTFYRIREGK